MISKSAMRLIGASFLTLTMMLLSACDSNSDVDRFVQAEEIAALGLSSLSLAASASLINAGETAQFSVSGKDSSNAEITNLETKVTWATSNKNLATVDSRGLVTAIADGEVAITASYAYLQASSTLSINTADLVQLNLSGDAQVDECKTSALTVNGVFSDGSTRSISSGITWSVLDTTVASIKESASSNDAATLMTHKAGSVTVVASKNQISGSLDIDINDALQELIISPLQATVSVGNTITYGATGVYANSEASDITASTLWTSVDTDTAAFTTTTSGVLTAKAAGSTTIVGACGDLTQDAVATINELSLTLVSINFNKSSITLDVDDDGYQLTLRATYSDGSVVDVTEDADWSNISSALGNIVVSDNDSSKGELTIIGTGSANIEAEYEGESDTILIIVE